MSFTHQQATQFINFFLQNGTTLFNLAVLEPRKSGEGECMKGDSRSRDAGEVEKSLDWATARNMSGNNVYFRPARYAEGGLEARHPVVLLDDLDGQTAEKIAKKYRAIVIETSAGNNQAWIITSQQLAEGERHQAQAALAGLVGADPGSTSGEHFGRIPGYKNQKPGRGGFWIKIKSINSYGPALDVAPWLSAGVDEKASKEAAFNPPQRGRVPSQRGGDESASEFRFAMARLAAGRPAREIAENIAARALERGKRRTMSDALRYAEKTITAAEKALR